MKKSILSKNEAINMKKHYEIRSDFADEAEGCTLSSETFTHEKTTQGHIQSSYIKVLQKENTLGKEVGDYVSVQFEQLFDHEEREQIIKEVCAQLHKMLRSMKLEPKKILIVGLGNRFITSDALGPEVANDILVTAHYYANENHSMLKGTRNVAVIQPGVMGQTGLESCSVVQAVVNSFQPDLVIAVDALATRNVSRINRVIQVNNTGIQPGSGVGNHRAGLSEESLQVPVIAIGVATVTSIGAILKEALQDTDVDFDTIFSQITAPEQLDLVVTPKAMDDELKQLVYLVSESLNRVIHPQYLKL